MLLPLEIEKKLDQIDSVATLPHIATEVLEVMRSKDTSMRKIAAVIEKDPSITVKILKIANSPLWGSVGTVESVQRALVLLGLKQVSNIVIAISLYSTFAQLKPNPHFNRDKFWRHSVGTAQIARKLCKALRINLQGEEFVAGLIHDLGKIVMDQFMGDKFKEINEEARENNVDPSTIEQKHLGCTHAEIGAALLKRWNFPEAIVTTLQFHHFPEKAEVHQDLVSMINLTNEISKYWESKEEDKQLPDYRNNKGWQILEAKHPHISDFNMNQFIEDFCEEVDVNASLSNLMAT